MAVSLDLEELADYRASDLPPDDCMGLSDLDGFLTRIVVGPEPVMPSEWFPVIWGHGFNADPEKFEPIFWGRPTGETIVMDCAAGLLDAVEMRRAGIVMLTSLKPRA
jgi:uncharacterized protein